MTTRQAWEQGIDQELSWWRGYLTESSAERSTELRARFDPAAMLQAHVAQVLPPAEEDATPRILDCAAGPATILGKVLGGRVLSITAVDALADSYATMLKELGLIPPVPTIACDVEQLDRLFTADSFDLAYMRFALDHCYDPLRALQQMVRVVRPGGVVMVEHYRDETETEYAGLRNWDLRPEGDDLVVANARDTFSVGDSIPDVQIEIAYSPTWLTMLLRKGWQSA